MSKIQTYLQKILSARYGKDVRQSIHDAIEEIDIVASTAQNSATKAAESAANSATMASEYESKAEQYKNEAKQFRDEAESFVPDGYSELVQNVTDNTAAIEALEQSFESTNTSLETFKTETSNSIENLEMELDETTYKVDTIIEKANLGIKNTASGEDIHLTDSADSKVVDFALFGNTKQNKTTGKSLFPLNLRENTYTNGDLKYTVYSNGIIEFNGMNNYNTEDLVIFMKPSFSGMVTLTGSSSNDLCFYPLSAENQRPYADESKTTLQNLDQNATNKEVSFYVEEGNVYYVRFKALRGKTFSNLKTYPMIRRAEIEDGTFEPYTGGIPSPSPEYPQEIEASGASGSVVVKSCGKNLLNNTCRTFTEFGVTFQLNEDNSVLVNGKNTSGSRAGDMLTIQLDKGRYLVTGCPKGGSASTYYMGVQVLKNGAAINTMQEIGDGLVFDIEEDNTSLWFYPGRISSGYTANNLLFKPMIRRLDENGNPIGDDTYEPYKETAATIQTPNGIVGIPVSSGGNYTDENGQQWICDEIVKFSDGTGERIHRIGIVEGDSAKGKFYSVDSVANTFFINGTTQNFNNDGIENHLMCNLYSVSTLANLGDKKISTYTSSNGDKMIAVKDTDYATLESFKELLNNKHIVIYYVYANPIHTPLTAAEIAEIEKLNTFYPVTHITNNGDCEMKVTYLADSKNYIDNQLELQKQAQEAAMINMLLLLPDETQAAMIENDTNNLLLESEE